jgi:hypothetical protein
MPKTPDDMSSAAIAKRAATSAKTKAEFAKSAAAAPSVPKPRMAKKR